ncbi:120_t:CDS:1, partial [Racocetra persica]
GNNANTESSGDNRQSFPDLSFCSPKISFSDIHSKVNYCKSYVKVNELSKKAIPCGLDVGSNAIQELEDFMNSFITKYAPKKKEKTVYRNNMKQGEDEDEDTSNNSSSVEDFVEVENSIVHTRKGAPRKKRFKGSHESVDKNKSKQNLEIQKTRKPTQCQQCQNTSHNKAGCEAWHKRQGVPYLY